LPCPAQGANHGGAKVPGQGFDRKQVSPGTSVADPPLPAAQKGWSQWRSLFKYTSNHQLNIACTNYYIRGHTYCLLLAVVTLY
jgi:hypothetical protein